jgi:hypothetical protein
MPFSTGPCRIEPEAWQITYTAMQVVDAHDGIVGIVKCTRSETIPSGSRKVVRGLCRLICRLPLNSHLAITEAVPEHALPSGLLVSPGLGNVYNRTVSICRINIEIQNYSNRCLVVPANTPMCNLHHVQLVNHVESNMGDDAVRDFQDEFMHLFDIADNARWFQASNCVF